MAKNNLFKWNKGSSSGIDRKKEESGVQAWIKRVQAASDGASIEAYGSAIPGIEEIAVMQPDDQAIYEAQELVDKWMQGQHLSELNLELEFKDENWSSKAKPMISALTDNNDGLETYALSEDGHILTPNSYNNDDYDDISIDYEEEAQKMFRKFMNNTNVEETVMSDLGMEKVTKKFKDPRPKMEQRHQLVKERNKARKEKIHNKQREKMMKRDAEVLARKKIQEEEKARKMKQQKEEAAIQRQMAAIRKEMEEERLKGKEEQERRQRALKEAEEQVRFELRQKEVLKKEEEERRIMAEEKMRRRVLVEMEEKSLREAAESLRLLHKVFSAWYGLVVDNRIKVGKARAMCDWKCKLRAWNAWRAYINHLKSCKEAEDIAMALKIRYRKEQMAISHAKLKLMRKCFISWRSWAKEQFRLKEIKSEQQKRALKMATFLEKAASGKLWGNSESEVNKQEAGARGPQDTGRSADINGKIDEIFENEDKKRKPSSSRKPRNRPLSMTFTKKDPKKFSEYTSNRHEQLNAFRTGSDKSESTMVGADEKKLLPLSAEPRLPVSENGRSDLTSYPSLLHSHRIRDASSNNKSVLKSEPFNENVETRLNLDEVDSESVSSAMLSDERESKRCKEELLSRKSTVKSEKAATKPVLLPMEERAKLRAEKKAILEERRKRQDEEKLERLKIEQEKLMIAEIEMKKEKIRQKKEQEREKKEREHEKQQRQLEYKIACEKADAHHCCILLRRFGLEPWKRLVEINKLNAQIAEKYYARTVFRNYIQVWKQFTDESKREKILYADECFRVILLRRSFKAWKKYGKHYGILEDVAKRHFKSAVVKKYFQTWQYYVTNERLTYWSNEEKAEQHDEKRLLKSALSQWKAYVEDLKEERKRQKRKDELRKKVKAWLPDFST